MNASQTKMYRLNFRLQHDSNRQNSVFLLLEGRLHVHVPLRYTKARSLHLACLKTPPTARGFAMIGCRLSCHRILTFTSLAESSSTIVTSSTFLSHQIAMDLVVLGKLSKPQTKHKWGRQRKKFLILYSLQF